jgi:hypothetical protein
MSAFQLLIAMALLALASPAAGEEGKRGSIAQGTSQDGSSPSGGALKGGAILPGETGGMPRGEDARVKTEERCKELAGTLREDCLKQAREAAPAGATGQPSDIRRPKAERAD